jgi:ankyrin repeat protein
MSVRTLPLRPDLDQLKLQARELRRDHAARKASAAARIAASHPRRKGQSPEMILATPLKLADAQLVLAREYGFAGWAQLRDRVERAHAIAEIKPHPRFDEALAALKAGELTRLRRLLVAEPELVSARTNLEPPYGYFSGAMLLHHVAGNPTWDRPLPANICPLAVLLLEQGADPNAMTLGPNRSTTIGLLITSAQASDANVSGPLLDLLLAHGATLDANSQTGVIPDRGLQSALDAALANHAPRAAERLIELGAKVDVCAAAALGRMDLLQNCFDAEGRLRPRPKRSRKALSQRDAIGLAMLFAYVNKHSHAVDFLLQLDGNWDMTGVNNGTALHRAAWDGDLAMIERLVARGADVNNRDNPFTATPLSWAAHNKQETSFHWLWTYGAIDLHDAVCFDLREHVEARLREDPRSINKRLDQWDIPQSTPLHCAVIATHSNADGTRGYGEAAKSALVKLLLDRGADPNILAGTGQTALDIATAAGLSRIVALLEERGGRRASEL